MRAPAWTVRALNLSFNLLISTAHCNTNYSLGGLSCIDYFMLPCGLGFEPRKEFSGCQTSPSKRRKRRCHSFSCLRTGEGKSSRVQGDPGLKKNHQSKRNPMVLFTMCTMYFSMRARVCSCVRALMRRCLFRSRGRGA